MMIWIWKWDVCVCVKKALRAVIMGLSLLLLIQVRKPLTVSKSVLEVLLFSMMTLVLYVEVCVCVKKALAAVIIGLSLLLLIPGRKTLNGSKSVLDVLNKGAPWLTISLGHLM